MEGYPGLYRDVQTYLRERIKEVLTGTSESIVVRIFGPDLPVLREKADEIAERIAEVDGVIDAHPDFAEDLPHIEVELNLAAARRHGLKPGDVRRQSSTLLASEEVSDIFHGGKAYDVHVWSIPSARNSVTRRRAASDRHARAASPFGSSRWPTCASRRPPTTSSASCSRAGSTWAPTWRAATSPRSSTRSRIASTASSSRASTTPRCWASPRS